MASKLSTAPSLNRETHHTSPRTSRLALIAALSLASTEAMAQRRPAPRTPLVPYLLVPAGSPEAAAAQAVRTGRPTTPVAAPTTPAPTPAASGLNFTDQQPATPVAAVAPTPTAQVPVVEAQPAQVAPQPTNEAPTPHPAPANETPSETAGSRRRRDGVFTRLGVIFAVVPNLEPRPEAPNASNITISARNCADEIGAGGPTTRRICPVTITGGGDTYTVTGNSAEVAMGMGTGRQINVIIPQGFGTLTVRTPNGASRTFLVGANQGTFSSQVINETAAPEQPVRVSVIPAVEATVGYNTGAWEVSGSARAGIVRPHTPAYYLGLRANVSYHGRSRTNLAAVGIQTGVDAVIPEGDGSTQTLVPVEATVTLRTSASTNRPRGVFTLTAGATIPTNTNPVAFTGSVGAGVEF
jgi:hypothetical protein